MDREWHDALQETMPEGQWIEVKGDGWSCSKARFTGDRSEINGINVFGDCTISGRKTVTHWRELQEGKQP